MDIKAQIETNPYFSTSKVHYYIFVIYVLQLFYIDVFLFKLTI
jgi:hypothetical protein